jgi:hypothetical protein
VRRLTADDDQTIIRKGNGRKGAVYRFIKIFGKRTNIGSTQACNKAIEIKSGILLHTPLDREGTPCDDKPADMKRKVVHMM